MKQNTGVDKWRVDEELRREVRTEDTDVQITSMLSGIRRADKFTQEETE